MGTGNRCTVFSVFDLSRADLALYHTLTMRAEALGRGRSEIGGSREMGAMGTSGQSFWFLSAASAYGILAAYSNTGFELL